MADVIIIHHTLSNFTSFCLLSRREKMVSEKKFFFTRLALAHDETMDLAYILLYCGHTDMDISMVI